MHAVYVLCINMPVRVEDFKFMENMQQRHFEHNVTFCSFSV